MCGIVGVYNKKLQSSKLAHRALVSMQHRGQEAVGIVSFDTDDRLTHIKAKGLVSDKINLYDLDKLIGHKSIGHVRYSTVSSDSSKSIQPFVFNTKYGEITIAHNGHINNYDELKILFCNSGAVIHTSTDTEIIAHIIANSKKNILVDAIGDLEDYVDGAYSLVIYNNGKIYGVKDKYGIRPLCFGKMDGGYVLASESCAISTLGAEYIRELGPGEIFEIDNDNISTIKVKVDTNMKPCVFESVYFSKPDSVFGESVYNVRIKMGEILWSEDSVSADLVMPVPNSGIVSALGYSYASGIKYGQPLIRNEHIGRTFIMPTQDDRLSAIKSKLSIVKDQVEGKSVVLIDDSIVRGNTSKKVVSLLREAGVNQVHFRSASPIVRNTCHYGIDTPTRDELIANRFGLEDDICSYIGADSLRYLSLYGLMRAVGNKNHCMVCFGGRALNTELE